MGRLIAETGTTASSGSTMGDQAALFRDALLAPQVEGPRKGGLHPACLISTGWLTAVNKSSLYAGRNKE